MVRAWYMDDSDLDQRADHHLDPPQYVNLDELEKKTGVLYWEIDADNYEAEGKLAQIRKDRGYSYEDVLDCSRKTLPNYDEKLKIFFQEHMHADEEVRFVLEGSGFFDVRDKDDKWIRIAVSKGDLITLPAGIYHRFTLDTNDYIKAIRLFVGTPVWAAINRPAEDHPARIEYMKKMSEAK